MATRNVPSLDGSGKIFEKHIPDLLLMKAVNIEPSVAALSPAAQTAYFQALFAAIEASGVRTVIHGGAQHFVVARQNVQPTGLIGMEVLFVVPANATFDVQDGFTIELDPATTPSATGLLMFQTGEMTDGGTAGLKGGTIITNNELIGGGSVWAWGNRRPSTYTATTDDVVVDGAKFKDARVAITNARQSPEAALANPDKNWRLVNGRVDKCNNRAIELSQMDGATIENWVMRDVESGLHLVGYAKNIRARNLDIISRGSSVWINYGCEDVRLDNCRLSVASGYDPSQGTIEFHSEPALAAYTVKNVRINNTRLGVSPTGTYKRSLTFMLTSDAVAVVWEDIRFKGVEFDGDVVISPATNRPGGESRDIWFIDCDFRGSLVNLAKSDYNAHDFHFINCRFTGPALTLNADRFYFRDCEFTATPTIAATANQAEFIDCITPAAIVNNGVGSVLQGNIVRPGAMVDPATIAGMTVYDANALTAGTFTTWAPVAGTGETVSFTPVGTAPTVVAAAMNGHKVVRFDAATFHRIATAAFAAAKSQPYTLIEVYKVTDNAADQNLLAGLSNNQPIIKRLASGSMNYRPNAAASAVTPTAPYPAVGSAHVEVVEFNGATSHFYTDAIASKPSVGTLTQLDPLSGIRFGSSGSGGSPYFNGDLHLIAFYPGILTETQRSSVIRFLGNKVNATIAQ